MTVLKIGFTPSAPVPCGAFDGRIGQSIKLNVGDLVIEAILMAAQIVKGGRAVLLTIEVDPETARQVTAIIRAAASVRDPYRSCWRCLAIYPSKHALRKAFRRLAWMGLDWGKWRSDVDGPGVYDVIRLWLTVPRASRIPQMACPQCMADHWQSLMAGKWREVKES